MADDQSASDNSPQLWRHAAPEKTQFYAFQQHVKQKQYITGDTYQDLWQWSVDHPDKFWEEIWHYTGIKASKPYDEVLQLRQVGKGHADDCLGSRRQCSYVPQA